MKIAQLFSDYPAYQMGEVATQDVTDICFDSREVQAGSVFVAIRGSQMNGHDYVDAAIEAGAIAVVVEDTIPLPGDFKGSVVVVPSARAALFRLAARWHGFPAEKLFCVGVTGTNGKTTTAYMVEHVLNRFGWPTGVLGTIDHHLGERVWASALTTPDAMTLQKRLSEFLALKARASVFEVSSHALDQFRVDGVPFNAAIFSNLTRDHLDYHGDMESYFQAKARLFLELIPQSNKAHCRSMINTDDEYGKRLIEMCPGLTWSFGQGEADLRFQVLESSVVGSKVHLQTPLGETEFELQIPGEHNVYNMVSAIGVGLSAGASLEVLSEAASLFTGVPGRLERVHHSQGEAGHVFVDYAHTPDALERVLQSLKSSMAQSKDTGNLICVFGCGGDRDRGKRPLMGEIAARLADHIIVTSDNPRTEPPEEILEDIVAGIESERAAKIQLKHPDRRYAIEHALQNSKGSDVILIAGKGHEDYQILGTETLHFSDVEVVTEFLRKE